MGLDDDDGNNDLSPMACAVYSALETYCYLNPYFGFLLYLHTPSQKAVW